MGSSQDWDEIVEARKRDPQEATRLIYKQYANRVLGLIRRNLDEKLGQRLDAEDIANDMWHEFILKQGSFVLDDRDSLLGMLLTMAVRKVARAARANKDMAILEQLDSAATAIDQLKLPESIHRNYVKMAGSESTPDSDFFEHGELEMMCYGLLRDADRPSHSDAAAASIAIEMVESLPADAQELVLWRLQGYSNAEVAEKTGLSTRSVDRWLDEIRSAWNAHPPSEPADDSLNGLLRRPATTFSSQQLLSRIRELFGYIEGEPKHAEFVSREAYISRSTLQRYLNGETTMRLRNVGKVLTAIKKFCLERPHLRDRFEFGLLDPNRIADGLSEDEYQELCVSGAAELSDNLTDNQMPKVAFSPVAQEIVDQYESNELFTKQLYIPLTAHRMDEEAIVGFADQNLLDLVHSDIPVLFLLGDLGTGTTTTVRHLEYCLAKEFLMAPQTARFPIYINLRDFTKAISLDWCLVNHFAMLDIPLSTAGIHMLSEAGRLVILFDGFDEMSDRLTTLEIQKNLDQIAAWSHAKSKTLLSSRTHLYKSDDDIREAYEKIWPKGIPMKSASPLILNRFTEADWTTYLNRLFGAQAEHYKEMIKKLDSYESLMKHPLLLDMTTKVLPELAAQGEFRRIDVFERYVTRWTEREEWRSSLQPSQRLRLAEELAWSLFIHNAPYISFRDLQHLTEEFFPQTTRGREIDVLQNEIRTTSFLNRNDVGQYSFVSPVFNYYFLARAIQKRIDRNDPANLGRQELHDEVLNLLAEMKPDTTTLMGWSSQQTDSVVHTVGPYLQNNARAILARISPIRMELIGKLENVPRKAEFASDPLLAHIANTSLPNLESPVRTIDIFRTYVDPWFDSFAGEDRP